MAKFILYALLVFIVIQMVRTFLRIKGNARQWKGEGGEEDKPKPPVVNIPDIQDAKFEDLTGLDDEGTGDAKGTTKEPPKAPPSPQ